MSGVNRCCDQLSVSMQQWYWAFGKKAQEFAVDAKVFGVLELVTMMFIGACRGGQRKGYCHLGEKGYRMGSIGSRCPA